jgi:hypothetical protein
MADDAAGSCISQCGHSAWLQPHRLFKMESGQYDISLCEMINIASIIKMELLDLLKLTEGDFVIVDLKYYFTASSS